MRHVTTDGTHGECTFENSVTWEIGLGLALPGYSSVNCLFGIERGKNEAFASHPVTWHVCVHICKNLLIKIHLKINHVLCIHIWPLSLLSLTSIKFNFWLSPPNPSVQI